MVTGGDEQFSFEVTLFDERQFVRLVQHHTLFVLAAVFVPAVRPCCYLLTWLLRVRINACVKVAMVSCQRPLSVDCLRDAYGNAYRCVSVLMLLAGVRVAAAGELRALPGAAVPSAAPGRQVRSGLLGQEGCVHHGATSQLTLPCCCCVC